eukprot:GHVL01037820.1.p1 GENE.GHVL01037820.1~~GHVL01037820.1.p1  ORF type:complete len:295 (+),score=41.52 GHVL01037820.1:261-1145(+)
MYIIDGRVLFYLPWESNTIVGTTDSKSELTALPKPSNEEIDFIVLESARYLSIPEDQIRKDIKAAWSGIRPLVKDPDFMSSDSKTSKTSRTHEVIVDTSGMISLMGGKWTTYRRMAQDCLDKVLIVHKDKLRPTNNCRTKNLLVQGSIDPSQDYSPKDAKQPGGILALILSNKYKISLSQSTHLVTNYGFRAEKLLQEGAENKTNVPFVDEQIFLLSEVHFAVKHDMARTIPDVLSRRIRAAFIDTHATEKVIDQVADIMAGQLKWDPTTRQKMVAEGREFVASMKYDCLINKL